ncbi:MAG: PepSY-associated TM helix domain-containing protein [Bacteroidota bacterium]
MHRLTSITIAVLVLISALTGILLAFKKDVALIQPPTTKGQSTELQEWKPLHELAQLAKDALSEAHPSERDNAVDKIDARPSKGIVKVIFDERQWEVQLDAATGQVQSVARRHSDWIESLHDGSIVSDAFKLLSMNVLGWGLLLLVFSGLWVWYGPRKMREMKKNRKVKKLVEKSDELKG